MTGYSFDDPGFRKFAQVAVMFNFANRLDELLPLIKKLLESPEVKELLESDKGQEEGSPKHEEQEGLKDGGEPVDDNDDLIIASWIKNANQLQSWMETCKLSECQKQLLYER